MEEILTFKKMLLTCRSFLTELKKIDIKGKTVASKNKLTSK